MACCRAAIGAGVFMAAISTMLAAALAHDESKYPDWSGQWRRPPGVGVQWDETKPIGLGQKAPLIPEYQAMLEASIKDQLAGGQGLDTRITCITNGMPRIMTFIRPVEFVVLPNVTYIHYENIMPRRIYTDGRAWPQDNEPTFVGYSIGKWIDQDGDGRYDLLEVETRDFKGPRNMEPSGLPLHADHRQGAHLSRQGQQRSHARRDHRHRPCLHATLDSDEDLAARPQRPLVRGQLQRKQQSHHHRQGKLFPQRRRLPDAGAERPGAARPALFQTDAEVIAAREGHSTATSVPRPLVPRPQYRGLKCRGAAAWPAVSR
jgi:hypothetical protein